MNEIRWITNGIRACFYLNVAAAVFLSFSAGRYGIGAWVIAGTIAACSALSILFERGLRKLDD